MKIGSLVQHKIIGCGRIIEIVVYSTHIIYRVDFGHSIMSCAKHTLTLLYSGDVE